MLSSLSQDGIYIPGTLDLFTFEQGAQPEFIKGSW